MKENYIKVICILTCILSLNVNAQDFKKSGFGIKVGINGSNLHTLNETPEPFMKDSDMKVGFYVGIFGEISLTNEKDFSLQPEVYYSQEGYKKKFDTNGTSNKVNSTLPMVKIPVLLKYYLCDEFSVVLGPQFGFFGKEKWEFDVDSKNNPNPSSSKLKDSDFSIASGFSYNTKFGMSVDFRYNHGAKSIYKNTEDVTTRNFQLGLSYKF